MSYEVIKNPQTGSKFIVFAKGMGLVFALRAWVETEGGNTDKPSSHLCLRFRAESVTADPAIHVAKAVENLFPAVKWGNGSPTHRSALASFSVPGLVNGTVLANFLTKQGALATLYAAWTKALVGAGHGVAMTLTQAEFIHAIVTTMEGEIDPTQTNVGAKVPFQKYLMEQVLNDEQVADATAVAGAIGLQ